MKRVVLLSLCATSLFAATIPDQLELRANREHLSNVLESIADQCGAGLVVLKSVQERLNDEVTLPVRKVSWAEASRWMADEFHITMNLVGQHLEIGDSNRALRDRLITVTYDIRNLIPVMSNFLAPDLKIPEPDTSTGVVDAFPLPPETVPGTDEFTELILDQIAPDSWSSEGVAIEAFSGSLVITQSPEIQKLISEFIASLERAAARQIIVRCHRLPMGINEMPVVNAATWTTLADKIAAPIAVIQLRDEQVNSHFSGTQQRAILDVNVEQETYRPVVTTLSSGLAFGVEAYVTNAGVVTTTKFTKTSKQGLAPAPITSSQDKVIAPIDMVNVDHFSTNDTRIIPDGGAALYQVDGQKYALSVEVLDFTQKP